MLLVKWKELKSLNSKNAPRRCNLYVLFFITTLFHSPVFAQEGQNELSSSSTFISIFLSLLLVIAIILALAYVMRRFNVTQAGNGQMRVVASLVAGAKEKVMVIEVGDEQHLLGVTSHNINHLAKLEQPLTSNKVVTQSSPENSNNQSFQQKLVSAMAQQISGKVAPKSQTADAKKESEDA